jgi:hypothetical protein
MSTEWNEVVAKRTSTEFSILLIAKNALRYIDSHKINSRVITPETKKTNETDIKKKKIVDRYETRKCTKNKNKKK